VRWIFPDSLPAAVQDWIRRFPAGTETREDTYLLQPRLRGLSLKLRDGSTLDVKSYLGSPALPGLPVRGRVESWRKWSFPYDPQGQAGSAPAGWLNVRKQRRSSWFPLAASHGLIPDPQPAVQAGCAVELTEFHVHGDPYWTVGFEATGPVDLLPDALQHAADLVLARPLPDGVEFILDNSRSYAQWLAQLPSPRH
jgi:hypothetical protein